MKTLKNNILLAFMLSSFIIQSQENCFYIDSLTYLAYDKVDSTLYSGVCSDAYKNGKHKYLCEFENGIIKYGLGWNKKGVLIDSTFYVDGYMYFTEHHYYSDGTLRFQGTFQFSKKNDKNVIYYDGIGNHVWYRKNGLKKTECFYLENGLHYYSDYYKNGKIESTGYYYRKDSIKDISLLKKDSVHCYYRKDGTIERETSYSNGKKHGKAKFFYENGTIKEIRTYKNGKFINPSIFLDADGEKFEITYNKFFEEKERKPLSGKE